MGRFKSISKRKKRKNKIILLIFLIILIIFIYNVLKNINLSKNKINYLTYSYLNMKQNKANPVMNSTIIENPTLKPTVYIYNTHQKEGYQYERLNVFNIDYNVYFASLILDSYLEQYGINALVETSDINKVLEENNFNYSKSYDASRILINNAYENNPTLNYFIDIHRDSSSYELTTCEIDNKKYAKVLFVVGKEHLNYNENLTRVNIINQKLINENDCLSRGVLEKSGEGVNGIYNQDFNKNTFLIEVGGQYNYIEEVDNTLKVLAKVLYEYIMEDS